MGLSKERFDLTSIKIGNARIYCGMKLEDYSKQLTQLNMDLHGKLTLRDIGKTEESLVGTALVIDRAIIGNLYTRVSGEDNIRLEIITVYPDAFRRKMGSLYSKLGIEVGDKDVSSLKHGVYHCEGKTYKYDLVVCENDDGNVNAIRIRKVR